MNKTLGLILSILFIFEIFLIGIPLTTTQAVTLPSLSNGIAVYCPEYSTVVFVFNVSNIVLSKTNVSYLAAAFDQYFTVVLNYSGTFYKLPLFANVTEYNIYFAYNPTTNDIEYVIILADVIGQNSTVEGVYSKHNVYNEQVPVSAVQQLLGISNLAITNEFEDPTALTYLNSTPVIGEAPSSVQSVITSPQGQYFYEYIFGNVTGNIALASVSIPAGYTTNSVLVFAPFRFITPGFFNPLQQSGALGSAMQSIASTKPYIWGRALINTSIIDPFVQSGVEPLFFTLSYSVTGALQINMAQVAWISAITNLPSSLTYLSYNFSNGYVSFIGIITQGDNATITINGKPVPSPISGYTEVSIQDGDPYYNVTLIAITPLAKHNGTVIEYVSNLTYYYYNGQSQQPVQGQFYYTHKFVNGQPVPTENYTLPVYGYYAPPGSKITIIGTFNGVTKNITITIGKTPDVTAYTAYTTLQATAYEIIDAQFNNYETTSPIMSTPPSNIYLTGQSQFQDVANMTSLSESSLVTLLTNATLSFVSVPLDSLSFNGIIVTPAYPFINGTTAMQYIVTSEYQLIGQNYEVEILGSQVPMVEGSEVNGLLNISIAYPPSYFANTLSLPSGTLPGTATGHGDVELEFVTLPQESYEILVDFGIWSNETVVSVSATDLNYLVPTVNTGYFYATIIPPRIITSNVTPQSFICGHAPYVEIYDPDAILVPGNPSGSFTYAVMKFPPKNPTFEVAQIFYGSNVYYYKPYQGGYIKVYNGSFSYINGQLYYKPPPSVNPSGISYPVYPNNASEIVNLQYYADNNPTVNFYFEQTSPSLKPLYLSGLNVSYSNTILSPKTQQIGYMELTPTNGYYNISTYVTFGLTTPPSGSNEIVVYTSPSSFVGFTVHFNYASTDYAVYHSFMMTGQYMVQTQITVPNVTASLYFAKSITLLYSTSTQLYFNEPYYAEKSLPAYLALGTGGQLTQQPSGLNLAKILSVNVTLPNGNKYTIALTTKNITTLFVSLDAQLLQPCNGTYEFEVSISGLESILGLNVQQLNGSILTVTVYDFVTHETLVASTKLVALKGLTLVKAQPGEAFYFLTFKSSTTLLTASTPWFIATSMYKEPALNLTDYEYANTNPTGILHLTIDSITVYHDGYMAMVYYDATSGRTIAINVYGKVVANYSGNLLPTISETAAGSGMFNGTLPFVIISNTTVATITVNGTSIYINGTLGLKLANGSVVPLGPAGLFVLPFVTYQGVSIGYDANVSVTVSDPVSSLTVSTYLMPANITPIRLAPIPIIPPMPHAPVGNYYYSKHVVINATNQVINIYVTSVIPYPYEFFIVAIVRPGANASTAAPVVYYSISTVVAKPALGGSLQPYIEFTVQMNGIISLPPGTYTVQMYAVPFAQGPAISEYPVSLIFTNVTIQ